MKDFFQYRESLIEVKKLKSEYPDLSSSDISKIKKWGAKSYWELEADYEEGRVQKIDKYLSKSASLGEIRKSMRTISDPNWAPMVMKSNGIITAIYHDEFRDKYNNLVPFVIPPALNVPKTKREQAMGYWEEELREPSKWYRRS